jgi:outer membrane protein assembly factor BamB
MWCKMRGRRFQVVAGLLAPAMMAGLALTAGPAHAKNPVSGGARAGSVALTRVLDSASAARPRIKLSRSSGTPTSTVTISGSGFSAHRAVDLYFDTRDKVLASTNGKGAFSGMALQVPSSALPGTNYITAVQRHSGRSAQAKFVVNTNWAQDGFSASHTGLNPYENVLSPSNVASLKLDWKGHVGSLPGVEIPPSPAVVDGVVYASSTPPYGGPSRLAAFSAATGKTLWSFTALGSEMGATPAVSNGTVYASFGGDLYALGAATGKVSWTDRVGGIATVANGKLYVGTGDGYVYVISAATGRRLSRFFPSFAVSCPPAVTGGVLFLGLGVGAVYALNAVTGVQLWRFLTSAAVVGVAVADGMAYVATSAGDVYGLSQASGAELWSFDAGQGIASPLAVANGVVYIDTSGPDGAVDALSATTGQLLWSFNISGGFDSSAPAEANGVVYVGSTDGSVYALSAATGAGLWRFSTGSAVDSSPAVVNGRLYIGSESDEIYAFGLPASQQAEARPRPSRLRPNYGLREQ